MLTKSLAGVAAAFLLSAVSPAAAADTPSLDDVAQAWKRTQEKIHSGSFQWETRQWLAKGSRTPPGHAAAIPESDVTFVYERELEFSNGDVRFESVGPDWEPHSSEYIDRRQIYTWDGETATRFNGDPNRPYAFVYDSNVLLGESHLRPIQFAFRMFHPQWYVFDEEKYAVSAEPTSVEGLECWNVETAPKLIRDKIARGLTPLKAVYTVCPERDFAVVRYAAVNESTGAPTLTMSISHTLDEAHSAWVPSEWTVTLHGGAGPFDESTSTVLDYVLNKTIADEEFVATLPVGTFVTDVRNSGAGHRDYVVRGDGEERLVTRDELLRGATREDLIATESGMAGLRQSEAGGVFSSPTTYLWIGGALLLLTGIGLAIRQQLSGST